MSTALDPAAVFALALICAPEVHPTTAQAIVQVESSGNPYAIGVVGGSLVRQPRNRDEAVATAKRLHDKGWNYSLGLGQINKSNFDRLALTIETAFDPCTNLAGLQAVLDDCHTRAQHRGAQAPQAALRRAISCYYSGNFSTGFEHGYVGRVTRTAAHQRLMPAP